MKRLLLLIVAALFAGSLCAQLNTEDSQILYLDFNDDGDLSYTDYDFVLNEEVDVVADEGKFAGGAWFDGEGSRIVFDPSEDWNHGMDWTLSMWLKTDVQEDFWGVSSFGTYSGDPNTDFYDEEERICGIIFSSFEGVFEVQLSWIGWAGALDAHSPEPWNDGEWHHLLITYSANADPVLLMYLDNVEVGSSEENFDIAEEVATINADEGLNASIEDDHFKLGFAGRGWLPEPEEEFPEIMFYEGYMDDVRLFNAVFTPENVAELYAYVPGGTRIGEKQDQESVKIYPNPANEYIRIEAGGLEVDLRIYNVTGQLIRQASKVSMVDISALSKGVYMVESIVEGTSKFQKLIVE
jgi:hypothetical protein